MEALHSYVTLVWTIFFRPLEHCKLLTFLSHGLTQCFGFNTIGNNRNIN